MLLDADVMILCAGLGTRLRPLTEELPKPAVPFFNRPLIACAVQLAAEAGAERVVINTHWLPDAMETAARGVCNLLGVELLVSPEPVILGSGGGLWQARERGFIRRDRPLIVLNGDVLTDVNLTLLLSQHVASGASATMVLRTMPAGGGYTPVEADAAGVLRRIGKFGTAVGTEGKLFTGAQVLSPEALDLLPAGESNVVTSVLAPLMERGRVHAFDDRGVWRDLGDSKGYLDAHLAVLRGVIPRATIERWGLPFPIQPVASGSIIASSARIDNSVIGAGAVVGEGAQLVECVIWPGARVDAGTSLRRCVVTSRSVVRLPE